MGVKVSNITLMANSPWVACPWYFWDFRIETKGWKRGDLITVTQILLISLAPSSLWKLRRAPEMSTIFGLQSLFKGLKGLFLHQSQKLSDLAEDSSARTR